MTLKDSLGCSPWLLAFQHHKEGTVPVLPTSMVTASTSSCMRRGCRGTVTASPGQKTKRNPWGLPSLRISTAFNPPEVAGGAGGG